MKFFNKDLLGLSENSFCEVCNKSMHIHKWADLDDEGFVIRCSENSNLEINEYWIFVYDPQQSNLMLVSQFDWMDTLSLVEEYPEAIYFYGEIETNALF